MNKFIKNIVDQNQFDFILAFKKKMEIIQQDMIELKNKAAAETIKAKMDEKVVSMEKERDWFRQEALKLKTICNKQITNIERLKNELCEVKEDKIFY